MNNKKVLEGVSCVAGAAINILVVLAVCFLESGWLYNVSIFLMWAWTIFNCASTWLFLTVQDRVLEIARKRHRALREQEMTWVTTLSLINLVICSLILASQREFLFAGALLMGAVVHYVSLPRDDAPDTRQSKPT